MSEALMAEGFRFWRDEVESKVPAQLAQPDLPVLALVGVYSTLVSQSTERTAHDWCRAVLGNDDAVAGLEHSLASDQVSQLHSDERIAIEELGLDAENFRGEQYHVYAAVSDGRLAWPGLQIPKNELFLSSALGRARHNWEVGLYPLRLGDAGTTLVRRCYPQTVVRLAELA